jgi:hypothetical protein
VCKSPASSVSRFVLYHRLLFFSSKFGEAFSI